MAAVKGKGGNKGKGKAKDKGKGKGKGKGKDTAKAAADKPSKKPKRSKASYKAAAKKALATRRKNEAEHRKKVKAKNYGPMPLDVLEKRAKKLNSVLKKRGSKIAA